MAEGDRGGAGDLRCYDAEVIGAGRFYLIAVIVLY